jgi:hypothetical protein
MGLYAFNFTDVTTTPTTVYFDTNGTYTAKNTCDQVVYIVVATATSPGSFEYSYPLSPDEVVQVPDSLTTDTNFPGYVVRTS